MTDDDALPRYDDLPPAPAGGRSAWGVLADNGLGRMALQTEARIREAMGLVRRGAVFSLNAPHDVLTPPLFRRGAVRHTTFGREPATGYDDVYDNYFPQASSQWDALAHIAYSPGVFFQGATAADIEQRHRNTIEHWARKGIVGRGVLLDLRRTLPDYEAGSDHAFTVDELELARERAGVEYAPGDIILLYTGFFEWYEPLDAMARVRLSNPDNMKAAGIDHSEAMARYLWDSGASGVVSDSPSLEVWPPDRAPESEPFGFLHRMIIGQLGIAIGELWWLADLAADCARDGRHEFLLTAAPVNMPGGIGSPANALAVK